MGSSSPMVGVKIKKYLKRTSPSFILSNYKLELYTFVVIAMTSRLNLGPESTKIFYWETWASEKKKKRPYETFHESSWLFKNWIGFSWLMIPKHPGMS